MPHMFRRRVEALLTSHEIVDYGEARGGPEGPWVEMTVRPLLKSYDKEQAFVGLHDLKKLERLLGTDRIKVTGYDRCPGLSGSDYVIYIVAHGVRFSGGRKVSRSERMK